MTVHRFIPAAPKHGPKTACGIKLRPEERHHITVMAIDGDVIRVSGKGEAFDCARCRRVLELRHGESRR